jgi:hypothetical protein
MLNSIADRLMAVVGGAATVGAMYAAVHVFGTSLGLSHARRPSQQQLKREDSGVMSPYISITPWVKVQFRAPAMLAVSYIGSTLCKMVAYPTTFPISEFFKVSPNAIYGTGLVFFAASAYLYYSRCRSPLIFPHPAHQFVTKGLRARRPRRQKGVPLTLPMVCSVAYMVKVGTPVPHGFEVKTMCRHGPFERFKHPQYTGLLGSAIAAAVVLDSACQPPPPNPPRLVSPIPRISYRPITECSSLVSRRVSPFALGW